MENTRKKNIVVIEFYFKGLSMTNKKLIHLDFTPWHTSMNTLLGHKSFAIRSMATNCTIIAHDNIFNRSVLNDNAFYFHNEAGVLRSIDQLNDNRELIDLYVNGTKKKLKESIPSRLSRTSTKSYLFIYLLSCAMLAQIVIIFKL